VSPFSEDVLRLTTPQIEWIVAQTELDHPDVVKQATLKQTFGSRVQAMMDRFTKVASKDHG